MMRTFKLFWLTGRTNIVRGHDIADACRRAGIGRGALPALDYYKEVEDKASKAPHFECPK